jgi:GNAT superfamily N-acetyltransferase
MSEIKIVNIEPKYATALEQLQRICYPTLGEKELMIAEHFLSHCRVFPEGNFVGLDGERVVGEGSGFFIDFDFDHPGHTFMEIIDGGYFTRHDPAGGYYYGADISVHPDYRGRGIGRMLYDARKAVVRRYNKKGIVAGGLIPGYARYKSMLTPHEYVDKVVAGELFDSTLSFQLRNGFQVRGLLQNYIEDSASDNWATLIEWVNPDFRNQVF